MSQLAVTPTFIDTILAACRQVQNGRRHRDVALHAVTELGELAQEVQIATGRTPGKAAGEDGIAGEALDVILCVVDFMHRLDPRTNDRLLIAAMDREAASMNASFTGFVLGGWRGKEPIHQADLKATVLKVAQDLGKLSALREAPFHDEIAEAAWPAACIIQDCLHLISTEIPGIDEEGLIRMARRKLDKWIAKSRPVSEVA